VTVANWIRLYSAMNLKALKLVTKAARPSLCARIDIGAPNKTQLTHRMTSMAQEISGELLVNGAATDASASDSDKPMSAALRAPQSLAPSPQKPTV
jgi:hypothetical protein